MLPTVVAKAAEEPSSQPPHQVPVEWMLVVWPVLLAAFRQVMGVEKVCPFCKQTGRVVRVVSLEQWQQRREQRGVG